MTKETPEQRKRKMILDAIKSGLERAKARGDEHVVKNLQAAADKYQAYERGEALSLKTEEKSAQIFGEVARCCYENGLKQFLLKTIIYFHFAKTPFPKWVKQQLYLAAELFETGQLKSWDQIFGKPFPGKRRKGLLTRSRAFEICREAERLKTQHNFKEDRGLFEQIAKNLKIGRKTKNGWTGWATVRDIYFEEKAHDRERDRRRLQAAIQNSQ